MTQKNHNKHQSHHEPRTEKKMLEKRNKNIYRKHEKRIDDASADEDDQLCDICGEYVGSRAFPIYNEYTGERVPGLFQCGKCLSTHPDE